LLETPVFSAPIRIYIESSRIIFFNETEHTIIETEHTMPAAGNQESQLLYGLIPPRCDMKNKGVDKAGIIGNRL